MRAKLYDLIKAFYEKILFREVGAVEMELLETFTYFIIACAVFSITIDIIGSIREKKAKKAALDEYFEYFSNPKLIQIDFDRQTPEEVAAEEAKRKGEKQ